MGQPSLRQVLTALTEAWRDRPDDVRRAAAVGPRAPRPADRARRRRRSPRTTSTQPSPLLGAGLRRGARRLRRGAQVPAVDGARVPAPHAPGARRARRCSTPPSRRWREAASTTSSAVASPATASTTRGWCRTSRRCSTTTPSSSASTRAGARRSATASPRWPPTSCCASCAPPRVGSPRRWTPTARARRGASTSGRPTSSTTCSVPTTAAGRPTSSRSTGHLRARHVDPAAAARPRRLGALRRRTRAGCSPRAGRGSGPARDDKVVAAWNGLAIAGLCDAGRLLGREEYVDAALRGGRPAGRRPSRRRPAAAGVARRTGRRAGGRAGGLRRRGRRLPGPVRGHRRRALADRGDGAARHRARALPGRRRRLPRHPLRRRAPRRATARPERQRQSVRARRPRCTPCSAAHALTGDGRWRDAADEALTTVVDAGAAGAAVRRVVARGRAGPGRRGTRDRGGRARPVRSATRSSGGPGPGPARWWSSPTAPSPAYRCWWGGTPSTVVPRRTCVATRSARPR